MKWQYIFGQSKFLEVVSSAKYSVKERKYGGHTIKKKKQKKNPDAFQKYVGEFSEMQPARRNIYIRMF